MFTFIQLECINNSLIRLINSIKLFYNLFLMIIIGNIELLFNCWKQLSDAHLDHFFLRNNAVLHHFNCYAAIIDQLRLMSGNYIC